MTYQPYPPQPKAGCAMYLGQLAAYALALIPGFVLTLFVPAGSFVRWTPVVLGVITGAFYTLVLMLPLSLIVRSSYYRQIFSLIILIYSLVWMGPLLIRYVNMALDDSPRVARTLTVLEFEKRNKGSDRITVEHWEPGEPPFTINGRAQPGETLQIHTHDGFLGFDWIEDAGDAYENERRHLLKSNN